MLRGVKETFAGLARRGVSLPVKSRKTLLGVEEAVSLLGAAAMDRGPATSRP